MAFLKASFSIKNIIPVREKAMARASQEETTELAGRIRYVCQSKTRPAPPELIWPRHDNLSPREPTNNCRLVSVAKRDDADWFSKACSFCRPIPEFPAAGDDSIPRNRARRSVSQFAAPPFAIISQCLLRQRIELAGLDVGGDLLVPLFRLELLEPFAELSKIVGRKLRNGGFDFLDCTHIKSLIWFAK
jgi:hypothetical protein